jgi:hypothetical protein
MVYLFFLCGRKQEKTNVQQKSNDSNDFWLFLSQCKILALSSLCMVQWIPCAVNRSNACPINCYLTLLLKITCWWSAQQWRNSHHIAQQCLLLVHPKEFWPRTDRPASPSQEIMHLISQEKHLQLGCTHELSTWIPFSLIWLYSLGRFTES